MREVLEDPLTIFSLVEIHIFLLLFPVGNSSALWKNTFCYLKNDNSTYRSKNVTNWGHKILHAVPRSESMKKLVITCIDSFGIMIFKQRGLMHGSGKFSQGVSEGYFLFRRGWQGEAYFWIFNIQERGVYRRTPPPPPPAPLPSLSRYTYGL